MKIRIRWLILSLMVLIIFLVCIMFNLYSQKSSNVLRDTNINTGLVNYSVSYDESKNITVVGTYENLVLAYNEKGEKLWSFSTKGPAREIKIDEIGRKAYIGCDDRNLYILDLDKGTQLEIIKVQRRIYSIDINKDASIIAVSAGINSFKHGLYVYDNKGKQLWSNNVNSISRKVAFNNDYTKILLATDRAEIMEFDLEGKQIGSKKLDYAISDMCVDRTSKDIAILTGKCTYYLLDENLNQIATKIFEGEGLSIGATNNFDWIGIGTTEGRFYVVDKLGEKVFQSMEDTGITDINFSSKKGFVTGLGNFVYDIDIQILQSIRTINKIKAVTGLLVYLLPIMLIIFIVLTFKILSSKVVLLFKTLVKYRVAYIMLIPTFAFLIVFAYIPVIRAFTMAFTDWSIINSNSLTIKFTGLENFRLMIQEGYFLAGLKNLLLIIITSFIKILSIPLLVAELVFLMKSNRTRYWFRFLFVLPMVVPMVVTTLMWKNIYDPTIGLLNNLLQVFNLDFLTRVWLGDPATALWAIICMGFPFIDAFAFLVYYGGLINIPSELFEAAKVDGSNGWWNFTRIHLPLISPQMKMLIILSFIGSVQNFTPILILTNGGPGNSTYVPGLEMYYNATSFGRYGYACALGVVLFIAIFIGTLFNMRLKTTSDENE